MPARVVADGGLLVLGEQVELEQDLLHRTAFELGPL